MPESSVTTDVTKCVRWTDKGNMQSCTSLFAHIADLWFHGNFIGAGVLMKWIECVRKSKCEKKNWVIEYKD